MSEPSAPLVYPFFAQNAEQLKAAITNHILEIIKARRQPGAGELLAELQAKFDWRVRLLLPEVVDAILSSRSAPVYGLDYLSSNLGAADIAGALRGENEPSEEFRSTIDDLFRKSLLYRRTAAFREAVEFMARFRDYAPFNNLLVRIQNPQCSFYATERDWRERFKRSLKDEARPMLILAPMHPVLLVYDLEETTGAPLPEHFGELAATRAESTWSADVLDRTIENARRDEILVEFRPLPQLQGGYATIWGQRAGVKARVVVNAALDLPSRYGVLCHELAHIYLGHLGADADRWWPCRLNLSHATVEIEAEAVAYTIAIRAGLKPTSERYLSGYLGPGALPESVSMELIAKVYGRIAAMGTRIQPPRNRRPPGGARGRSTEE